MDSHIREFYRENSPDFPDGNFRKVIALHEAPDITWEALQEKGMKIYKGWFELAHLSSRDRIDFTRDFWLSILPYHPKSQDFITRFFDSLDDIGIFITQKQYEDEYVIQMVYSIANNGGFYRGFEPVNDDEMMEMERDFSDFIFPVDYLAFLRIHNGFRKATDKTGIFKTKHMTESYQKFQTMIESMGGVVTTERGAQVNPKSLIPFYESFGMPFFQCFWADWYPQNVTGMGNVYFSVTSRTVSDPLNYEDSSSLNMAFTRFLDWLMFYLERIE
jgi:hypothetical protein